MVSKWEERGPDSQPGRATIHGVRQEVESSAAMPPPPVPANDGQDGKPTDSEMSDAGAQSNGDAHKRREPEGGLDDRDEKRRRMD